MTSWHLGRIFGSAAREPVHTSARPCKFPATQSGVMEFAPRHHR